MPAPSDDVRFAFECPRRWSSLVRTTEPGVRYCGDCAQTVHLVTTASEARRLGVTGRCVALAPAERPGLARRVGAFLRAIVHGREPVPLERIPDPPPPEPPRPSMKVGMVLIERDVEPPAMGWLVEITGDRRGHLHVFRAGHAGIGSRSTDVVLDHPSVAPTHARIVGATGRFALIAEAGAVVLVGDHPVTRHELADGDRVTLGDVELIWKSL